MMAIILGVALVLTKATVYAQSVFAFRGSGSTASDGAGVIGGGQGNNGPGTIGGGSGGTGGVGDVCLSCFLGGTNGGQTGESIHAAIHSDISAVRAGLDHVGSGPTGTGGTQTSGNGGTGGTGGTGAPRLAG
jgi:hypothetical protein